MHAETEVHTARICRQGTPIAILGVPFDNVTTAETISMIEAMVASRRPHYLATANIDFLVQAMDDVELRRILFEAHLVICDGTPLVWASRFLGNPLPERVAGSDLVPLLIRMAAEKGFRIFFLGGSPDATEEAVAKLRARHPDLQIAGHYSPPYQHLLEMDHEEINRRIRASAPDLLFVSFGCPKQEKWIAMHYRDLGVPVAVGVGGTIDFLAGRLARAPRWMQRSGTEWIFRVLQEPRRLGKRYMKDMIAFGGPFLSQLWHLKLRRRRLKPSSRAPLPLAPAVVEEWHPMTAPHWLDMETVQKNALTWEQSLAAHRNCAFDLRQVEFIDSTGMGLLIRLQKRARIGDRNFFLIHVSEPVRFALKSMQLDEFFRIAPDLAGAQRAVAHDDEREVIKRMPDDGSGVRTMAWSGEITAANAREVWEGTERFILEHPEAEIFIDLSQVRFIDSTGLGIMVRAKKTAAQHALNMQFTAPSANVRNVLKLSKLDRYLIESKT